MPKTLLIRCIQIKISLPAFISSYFLWLGPLTARLIVGYVFMLTGWAKLNNLENVTRFFAELGIPYPEILTPFVAAVECFGGALLILGLFTQITGAMLSVVMIVATISAKMDQVDSLETLLGFEEIAYLAIFFWLAVTGAGKASLDYIICPTGIEPVLPP